MNLASWNERRSRWDKQQSPPSCALLITSGQRLSEFFLHSQTFAARSNHVFRWCRREAVNHARPGPTCVLTQ
jgi:hypothetical protein